MRTKKLISACIYFLRKIMLPVLLVENIIKEKKNINWEWEEREICCADMCVQVVMIQDMFV